MSENRVIGRDGALPWRLPADLKRFKAQTMDRTIIMGRRTWQSLPRRPLPRRRNVVLTRNRAFEAEGATVLPSLEAALAASAEEEEVFVIGGERLFREALPLADRIHLTLVHAKVAGDTYFPPWDESAWRRVEDDRREADENHAHAMSFQTFARRGEAEHEPRA